MVAMNFSLVSQELSCLKYHLYKCIHIWPGKLLLSFRRILKYKMFLLMRVFLTAAHSSDGPFLFWAGCTLRTHPSARLWCLASGQCPHMSQPGIPTSGQ